MTLREQLQADLKTAMKASDAFTTGVLRFVSSAVHNKAIEKKVADNELSDDDVRAILSTEAKKRREAADIYGKGGREDLKEKEERELEVVMRYLPVQLSAAEVEKAVTAILKRVKAPDIGSAMRAVIGELKGKGDAKLISEAVRKTFSQK